MFTGNDWAELVRLAKHSARLRAYLTLIDKNKFNRSRRVSAEMRQVLARLVREVKLGLRENTERRVVYVDWGKQGFHPAQKRLQRPEILDSEFYQRALLHADFGKPGQRHVNADLRAFAKRLVQLGIDRGVPLYVDLLYVRPEVQDAAYVQGKSALPAKLSPYCYGKACRIGHAIEKLEAWFDQACLDWLNNLALLAAADTGVQVGYGPSEPGEFLMADEDGVLWEPGADLPDPRGGDEVDRLGVFYSGGAWVAHPDGDAEL